MQVEAHALTDCSCQEDFGLVAAAHHPVRQLCSHRETGLTDRRPHKSVGVSRDRVRLLHCLSGVSSYATCRTQLVIILVCFELPRARAATDVSV